MHPEIIEAAERLASGPVAELIRGEASRLAARLPEWWEREPFGPWTAENTPSLHPDDLARVLAAAVAETVGSELRAEFARREMLISPARPRSRSAANSVLGLLIGTTRQGAEARFRLRERLPGDLDWD